MFQFEPGNLETISYLRHMQPHNLMILQGKRLKLSILTRFCKEKVRNFPGKPVTDVASSPPFSHPLQCDHKLERGYPRMWLSKILMAIASKIKPPRVSARFPISLPACFPAWNPATVITSATIPIMGLAIAI